MEKIIDELVEAYDTDKYYDVKEKLWNEYNKIKPFMYKHDRPRQVPINYVYTYKS